MSRSRGLMHTSPRIFLVVLTVCTSWTDALGASQSSSVQGRVKTVHIHDCALAGVDLISDVFALGMHGLIVSCVADTRILWKSSVFNDWDISVGDTVNMVCSAHGLCMR